MSDIDKDWCLDAVKREDGCEVGVDTLGMDQPLVKLRLELTAAQKEIDRLKNELTAKDDANLDAYAESLSEYREVISGQAYDLEQRANEFQILSVEVARLSTEGGVFKAALEAIAMYEKDGSTAAVTALDALERVSGRPASTRQSHED